MKKYGDIVNGFGYSGVVKSILTEGNRVNYAIVQNVIGVKRAKVYLVPPVWEENKLPKINDHILVGGLVQNKDRDTFFTRDACDEVHDIAGKAIFCEKTSIGCIVEITSWKEDHPFATVESSEFGNIKLSLSPDVWFEPKFPKKGDRVVVYAITQLCGEYFARGGLFWRIG